MCSWRGNPRTISLFRLVCASQYLHISPLKHHFDTWPSSGVIVRRHAFAADAQIFHSPAPAVFWSAGDTTNCTPRIDPSILGTVVRAVDTRAPFCAEFVIFSTPPKSPPARNFTHQRKRCCWLPPAYARILCASAKECSQTCARARSDTRVRCGSFPPPPTSRRRLFSLWRLCDHTNQPRYKPVAVRARAHARTKQTNCTSVRAEHLCTKIVSRLLCVWAGVLWVGQTVLDLGLRGAKRAFW